MTKTNKVGIVAGFKTASQLVNVNGFISGVWSVTKNITIQVTYTGSWTDVAKAYEAGITLVENGADWLCPIGSGIFLGVIQAAKDKGVYVTGCYNDMNNLAPNEVVTSVIYKPYNSLLNIIELTSQGKMQEKLYTSSMADGAVDLASYHGISVPQKAQDLVTATMNSIKSGSFTAPYIPNTQLVVT